MQGELILNYRITRLLGEGGMARVYEAVHIDLGTKAAIKILDPVLATKGNLKERFRNEARIMTNLHHDNIVMVLDYYEDDTSNTFAIIMEYLEGDDLAGFIKKNGALSKELAYDLMVKILNAFIYAHGKGLVHRDVKPGNIFITNDKNIKILDFGIAKMIGGDADLTSTGMQMGTPLYMSPEQVKDVKHLDKRSDIYSLGVMFYFMLTGKPPYDKTGLSNYDIFYKIVNEPLPELRNYSEFNYVIKKATAKKREERFDDCSFFYNALKSVLEKKTEKTVIYCPKCNERIFIKRGETQKIVCQNCEVSFNVIKGVISQEDRNKINRERKAIEDDGLVELTEWNNVKNSSDIVAIKQFLLKYPYGNYTVDAKKRIKEIKEEKINRYLIIPIVIIFSLTVVSLVKHFGYDKEIKELFEGKNGTKENSVIVPPKVNDNVQNNRKKEDAAWEKAKEINTIEAYENYKKQYPQGLYVEIADDWIEIVKQRDETAYWSNVREVNTIGAYKDYRFKYPNGIYKKEAGRRIEDLTIEETMKCK